MNPFEHLWYEWLDIYDNVSSKVGTTTSTPNGNVSHNQSLLQLAQALQTEWATITQYRNLVASMGRRCHAVWSLTIGIQDTNLQ